MIFDYIIYSIVLKIILYESKKSVLYYIHIKSYCGKEKQYGIIIC
jgi:hypothetical protein